MLYLDYSKVLGNINIDFGKFKIELDPILHEDGIVDTNSIGIRIKSNIDDSIMMNTHFHYNEHTRMWSFDGPN